jgi:hypothetical protein
MAFTAHALAYRQQASCGAGGFQATAAGRHGNRLKPLTPHRIPRPNGLSQPSPEGVIQWGVVRCE